MASLTDRSLQGRRILVTGASSGIGEAVARAAVAAGASVAVLARRAHLLSALAEEIGAVPVPADVTDHPAVAAAVDTAADQLGGLDALVNSVGITWSGLPLSTDPAVWRRLFDVNVVGTLAVTKAAAPHLLAGVAPSVVTVSSMSGRRVAGASSGVYAATKFALHALGEALRMELQPRGVRVTTLAPGLVRTPILDDVPDSPWRAALARRIAELGLDPAEVARAVLHVLSQPPEVTVVEYALMPTAQRDHGFLEPSTE
ncbi:aldehyde dehydrogenase [Longimycelium tulufanense]|uniref:Aldehyde dehydrogenase n=1 Tax=Longimycelium tulufanense TaxID=907463 RepID=A0A8J3CD39_9PSEU|nr:SDR family NAD(P)-dependent oxidoreductase [Longimycelium tulufanense]GGM56399.1 aldehyde dehydrogenase [Longimycelium tulufanense]